MTRRSLIAPLAAARRGILSLALSLALVGMLLPSTAGPAPPVRADQQVRAHRGEGQQLRLPAPAVEPAIAQDHPDPAARLQVVIRTVHVSNDRDGAGRGAGDMSLTARFWRCSGPHHPCSAGPNNPPELLAHARASFQADSGEAVNLNRTLPRAGDDMHGTLASEEAGIAVYGGQRYLLHIDMVERDWVSRDKMGAVQRVIDESNGWGIGLYWHEPAGHGADQSFPFNPDDVMCAGCGGIIFGDYLVTYEIRRTALPDLRPTEIRVADATGEVCLVARNDGPVASGPFRMSLLVDGAPAPGGNMGPLEPLQPGQTHGVCQAATLPTAGRHQMALVVDEERAVPEMNERNNRLEQGLDRTPLGSTRPPNLPDVVAPAPAPAPSSGGPILNIAPGSNDAPPAVAPRASPTRTATAVAPVPSTPTPTATPGTGPRTPTATPSPTSTLVLR